MKEFLKIAEEQDMLGLNKIAMPEPNPRQEDLKTIEEKKHKRSPEKSIIEEAHPDPVYVAEARGDGGLVENNMETQKRLIEIINKMPTGSIVGRYASCALSLKKIADVCDEYDVPVATDFLMEATQKLFDKILSSDPFEVAPKQ